jgi:NAD(P)-dependent dehydrogenase (short-subunit alcohol dehydrogenase family)
MKTGLIIFGAYGALGTGVTKVLIEKGFDDIYLFGTRINETIKVTKQNVHNISVSDLSVEKNVADAFSNITADKDKSLFLFSTIGGYSGGKNIWETEESDLDKMFNINLKINFFLAKYFAKLVKESVGGSICFTSAYTGSHAEAKKGAYGISKSALNHLVQALALEGKAINLSANAVAPYIIDTADNRQWMKNADYESWIKPEEIGEFVYNLFNNYSSISGNIFEMKERTGVK